MQYTVSDYFDPQPEDLLRFYPDMETAVEKASIRSFLLDRQVFAVRDSAENLIGIYIAGVAFTPVV